MLAKLIWGPIFVVFTLVAFLFSAALSIFTMLLGLAIMPFILLVGLLTGPKEDLSHYERKDD